VVSAAVAATQPLPPGEDQQGSVVEVHYDSGTPKPPAET